MYCQALQAGFPARQMCQALNVSSIQMHTISPCCFHPRRKTKTLDAAPLLDNKHLGSQGGEHSNVLCHRFANTITYCATALHLIQQLR
jgi:hypothetical protein